MQNKYSILRNKFFLLTGELSEADRDLIESLKLDFQAATENRTTPKTFFSKDKQMRGKLGKIAESLCFNNMCPDNHLFRILVVADALMF
jgi:hypothetical protein